MFVLEFVSSSHFDEHRDENKCQFQEETEPAKKKNTEAQRITMLLYMQANDSVSVYNIANITISLAIQTDNTNNSNDLIFHSQQQKKNGPLTNTFFFCSSSITRLQLHFRY